MPVVRVDEFPGKPNRPHYPQQSQALESHYKIVGLPGFEDDYFTEGSNENLSWPDAVQFAFKRSAVLQSAREAAAFRSEAHGNYGANRCQATRTFVAYFKEGNSFYAAIDDAPDKDNVVLARAQEGFDSYLKRGSFLLPTKDVDGILKRAEKCGRVIPVPDKSPLELATKQVDGVSAFGQNVLNQVILVDSAEPYAKMLHKRNYHSAYVFAFTPDALEQIGVSDKNVEVRPFYLGDINFGTDYIFACSQFYGQGHARGVRNARNLCSE